MICPGCAVPLKGKERTGRVCAHCRKRFALDPAVDGRGMNDIRIRGIVERATDHGRLRITLTQLWYLSRTHAYAWAEQDPRGVPAPVRWLVALPAAVVLLVCAVLTQGGVSLFAATAGCAALVIPSVMRHHPGLPPRSQIIPTQETFRRLMTVAWPAAYGRIPKGVVDDVRHRPRPRGTKTPRTPAEMSRSAVVILCTDRVAARFLTVNHIPGRLGAVLLEAGVTEGATDRSTGVAEAIDRLSEYPGALPVVVLHDADPLGVLLAPLIRAAQPGRVVVNAGLPVSAARGKQGVIRLARPNPFADAEQLRTVAGLSRADAEWLADGFWSPIAAVPPRVLESITVRAVERALAVPAPTPGDTRTHGFLTWPQAARSGDGTAQQEGAGST